MLFRRFEQDVFGVLGHHRRIEDLLFDGGVHCQVIADLLEELLARAGALGLLGLLELLSVVGYRGLRGLRVAHPDIRKVDQERLLQNPLLVEPGTDTPDVAAAARLMEATRARGLLVGKGGLHGNVLRIAPPLTLTEAEAGEGLGILTDVLEQLDRDLRA